MAGPAWLAGVFAAVVIVAGAYSASRLAVSHLRRRATEFDADALHAAMGVAMAGMLVPRLRVLPEVMWVAIFALGAAWFGWQVVRAQGRGAAGPAGRFPVPHLIECVAMLYMLLPVDGPRAAPGMAGVAMAGMGSSAGTAGSFPALAVVLALFMIGYIVWTTDRLTALVRARPATAGPRGNPALPSPAAARAVARPDNAGGGASASAGAGTWHGHHAGRPMLAPKLAACGKLAMSIAMGYMLILML